MTAPAAKSLTESVVTLLDAETLATLAGAGYVLPPQWPEGVPAVLDANGVGGWKVRTTDDGTLYLAPDGSAFLRVPLDGKPHIIGLSMKGSPLPLKLHQDERPTWLPKLPRAPRAAKAAKEPSAPAAAKDRTLAVPVLTDNPDEIKATRAGGTCAKLLDVLHPNGATYEQMAKAIDRTNVRNWLLTDIHGRLGYGLDERDGRVHLVYPTGMSAPKPHKQGAEKPATKSTKSSKSVKATKASAPARATRAAPKPTSSRKRGSKVAGASLKPATRQSSK